MDKFMDKLKENPRLVVATLITAGIIALLIGNNGDNNSSNGAADVSEETTQSQTAEEESTEPASDEAEATNEEESNDAEASSPEAGPVEVQKNDTAFSATVRSGDNQTVIVRQIVNDFLSEGSKSLGAEQRLYVETVLVNGLPRNDVIYTGDEISIDEAVISEAVEASSNLTEAQLALWAQYL